MILHHFIFIAFLFPLGACVGSFLNVVVWRLPRVETQPEDGFFRILFRSMYALSEPPSHCPKCNKLLKWYDNLPVVGWFKLGGKCRFCRQSISFRYPLIEAITGLMFVGYYCAFFIAQMGPAQRADAEGHIHVIPLIIQENWPIYFLDMMLLSGLLAASLIDAELFIIPIEIPWIIAITGIIAHAIYDTPIAAGNVMVGPVAAAIALGASIGLFISIWLLSRGVLKASFAEGAPMLEIEKKEHERNQQRKKKEAESAGKKGGPVAPATDQDEPMREWTSAEVRAEIRREMAFLICPMLVGFIFAIAAMAPGPIAGFWLRCCANVWVDAALGSVFGGLVGGFVVWLTRILGTLAFGREAMGMGDVDLMVGVGAVLGAGPALVAFFLAPFFGIALSLYMLITRKSRELPYGPYLSLGTACVILFYAPIAAYFAPGLSNLAWIVSHNFPGGN